MPTRFHIQDMRIIAQQLGGKCLSKEYIDSETHLEWMCKRGHTWDAPYYVIRQGGWCVQCARGVVKQDQLKELEQIAKERGGKCLSKEYINSGVKLKWQCQKGHQWWAKPNAIKNRGSWCRKCAGLERLSLQ